MNCSTVFSGAVYLRPSMDVRRYLSIAIGISFLLVFICRCTYGCNGIVSENQCFVVVYEGTSNAVSWNDANTLENGHKLASLTSQKQMDAVLDYIIKKKYINVWFYIGLSRKANAPRGMMNTWTWTSGLALEYDNWVGGEPNVPDKHCAGVMMYVDKKSQKKTFHDFICDQENYGSGFGLNYIYLNNCEEDTVKIGSLSYHFQATPSGSTANSLEVCPSNTPNTNSPMAYRKCNEGIADASWGDVIVSECGEVVDDEESIDDLETLYNVTVTIDNVEDVAEDLVKITDNVRKEEDVNTIIYSAVILKDIVGLNSTSDKVTSSVAASVDNLLEISNEVTDVSEESRSASSTIIKSLEEQLATVASVGLNYTFSRKNLHIEVVQLQDDFVSNGLVFYSSENSPALLVPSEKYASESVTHLDTSLKLPSEAFDVGTVPLGDGNIPSVFVLYKQSSLFPTANKDNNRNWTIGSRVISANFHGIESSTFTNPVIGVYTPTINKSVSENDINCVFWDLKLENGIGDWSNDGCLYNKTEDGRVICHCYHLTNFAVLMDFHGQTGINSKRYHVLSVLSLIGCCVSLTALILTICTLIYTRYTTTFSREQHSARPKLILLNFAIALSLLYLVFVVGIDQTTHKHACICISVLLHYFTISSISWMTVQAVNIYLSLVRIFPTYISKFRMKAYAFGWVIPLLPIVICLIVSKESYWNTDYCFLNPGPVLYYGNIAVAGALFFTNFVIFILVIRVLMCSRSRHVIRKDDKSKFTTAKQQVSTAIGLSILLGLAWVFGFAAIGTSTSSNLKFSMQLLFCVFNSLQGLFVFLFFSVRPGDFKAFVTSCLSSLSCSTQSYEIANKYDKHVALSHDTAGHGQSESMTHITDV